MPASRRTGSPRRAHSRYGKLSRVRAGIFAFPFGGQLASVLGMRRIPLHRSILRNTVCPDFRLKRAMIETLTILLRVAGGWTHPARWVARADRSSPQIARGSVAIESGKRGHLLGAHALHLLRARHDGTAMLGGSFGVSGKFPRQRLA